VSLAGGASTAQQYLGAGLVDEMEIQLVPMLLGAGERVFEGVSGLGGLQLVRR
jgi:dihydrofolate reductase